LAMIAAGIAVTKPGTYVVSDSELRSAGLNSGQKILEMNELAIKVRQLQADGKRVVFTNGCFDILHAGHLHNLRECRSHGDFLVVGLNSDESVRRLKGNDRPINGETNRAELLAALHVVDYISIFDEDTPEELVRAIAPDVLAKGGDYSEEQIAGASFVKKNGGKIVIIPLLPGLSSTGIINRSRPGIGGA